MDMKIGDLCWAKMKGFPSWPGKIIEAPNSEKYHYLHKKKLHHYIHFFGSGNCAWVPAVNIRPNSEEAIKLAANKRSIPIKRAVQHLKREMERNLNPQDLEEKYCRQGIIKKCMVVMKHASIREKCERNLDSQSLEEKYCRQGIIKKCKVVIKHANTNASHLNPSNSLLLNEVSPIELCHNEIFESQRKMWKIEDSTLNADNIINGRNNCQKLIAKKFGFIGCGELGKEIVKNLIKSKCDIIIWNQTAKEYSLNNKERTSETFLTLINACDIIICYIYNEDDAQSIFEGDKGILQSFANYQNKDKGFVLLANVDLKVSAEIAVSIQTNGGRYLGAPLLGSEVHVTNGDSLILCSGDETLFHDCKELFTCFNRIKYLGPDIELASKLQTIIGLFLNSISKSYKEAGNLIQELKLSAQAFNDLLKIVVDENSLATLCYFPLERKFSKEDRIRFFLEKLNLKTLHAANFSISD